jgi:hypothetical protein
VLFQNFIGLGVQYAIRVVRATELRLDSVEFKIFSECAVLDARTLTVASAQMWTLFDVTCTNIQALSYLAVLLSAFPDFYADGVTFTNCTECTLFRFEYGQFARPPVFLRLVVSSVTLVTEGLVGGLDLPLIIEGAVFTNTEVAFQTTWEVYFEDTVFIADDSVERYGLKTDGALSVIGCTFTGFLFGVSAMHSLRIFVCTSKFTGCGTCIESALQWASIVNCLFVSYTTVGLVANNGAHDGFVVEGCAFLGEAAPAIQFNQFLTLKGTCFSRNGTVVEMQWGELHIDADCCFRPSQSEAISVTEEVIVSEEGEFGCTRDCTVGSVSFEKSVCVGDSFSPRPTPWTTQVPIAPRRIVRTQSQSGEQSKDPQSASESIPNTQTPSESIPNTQTPSESIPNTQTPSESIPNTQTPSESITNAQTLGASIPVTVTPTAKFTPPVFQGNSPRKILKIGFLGFMLVV